MRYVYPFDVTGNERNEDGFLITFPDVPEAITGGVTRAKALEMAEDCLTVALGGYVDMGWELPTPSSAKEGQELVAVPPMAAAKLSIYTAMRQQNVTKQFLAQQLGLSDVSVDKLLIPDRHSPWSQVTRALELLGRKLVVEDKVA
jgi:antitoxin HicB